MITFSMARLTVVPNRMLDRCQYMLRSRSKASLHTVPHKFQIDFEIIF